MTQNNGNGQVTIERQPSVLEQVIDGVALLAQPVSLPGHETFVITPDKFKPQSLEGLLLMPRRVKHEAFFTHAESFCDYVERFKTAATIITSGPCMGTLGKLVAVLDFHGKPPGDPGWCQHTATVIVKLSRRFQTWVDSNKKMFTQAGFAEWLEERMQDVVTPPGAEMIEMVQWLEATSAASFKQVVNLTNGRTAFNFADPLTLKTQGNEVEWPRVMGLSLPMVEGEDDSGLDIQLRYRLESDKLKLFYRIPNLEQRLDDAWKDVEADVKHRLGLPFYRVH